MARVRQRGTDPERAVRRLLREIGATYRLNVKSLPGSPDVANIRQGVAVFVHGCFWHRHRSCRLATTPKRNHDFWLGKFAENRRRDGEKIRQLEALGVRTLVVWQCELCDAKSLTAKLRSFWWREEKR
jgi:DNA mismatch endonuclease, patch repair protein